MAYTINFQTIFVPQAWFSKFLTIAPAGTIVVGQPSTWKWHYCAVSVKSVRFGRECKYSISNIFLICHILWHFHDGRHWPWEFHTGQKVKHALIALKIVSIVCLVIRIPKMYSLIHLRCLVFKLHKIIGQRSFQICTGGQNLELLWF